jgi:hypothetical protein
MVRHLTPAVFLFLYAKVWCYAFEDQYLKNKWYWENIFYVLRRWIYVICTLSVIFIIESVFIIMYEGLRDEYNGFWTEWLH